MNRKIAALPLLAFYAVACSASDDAIFQSNVREAGTSDGASRAVDSGTTQPGATFPGTDGQGGTFNHEGSADDASHEASVANDASHDAAADSSGADTHPAADSSAASAEGFVTREGTRLVLRGQTFRFAGPNIPNLADSYDWPSHGFPTHEDVDYLLDTAVLMGARVVRSHGLGISVGHPGAVEPSHSIFDEEALKRIDYALDAAHQRDVRLVIPLSDNVKENVMGHQYIFTQWRGYPGYDKEHFWSDRQVIEDFKEYVRVLLTRVNSYSGIAYRDEPAILAWETGNELDHPPAAWTREIADYIKSLDPRHLVMDGTQWFVDDDLTVASIDIYTQHYYGQSVDPSGNADHVEAGNKVFVSGEYDWGGSTSGETLEALQTSLANIEAKSAVSGDLYWDLSQRQACPACGPADFTIVYPGATALRDRVKALVDHAFRMSQRTVPADLPAPLPNPAAR